MTQISGGTKKSRVIYTIERQDMRPASSRFRLALFNIIDVEAKLVLDIFAGCGCLGLEALSRSAKEVHFVEMDRDCLGAINKNVKTIGFDGNFKLFRADAFEFSENLAGPYDIILMDPPFRFYLNEKLCLKLELLLERLLGRCIILAMKHPKKRVLGKPSRTSHYGDSALSIYGSR